MLNKKALPLTDRISCVTIINNQPQSTINSQPLTTTKNKMEHKSTARHHGLGCGSVATRDVLYDIITDQIQTNQQNKTKMQPTINHYHGILSHRSDKIKELK